MNRSRRLIHAGTDFLYMQIAYTVLLAVGFIVNFYFAFYLCLFIVLYFLLQDWKTLREFGRGILRFLVWSVVAGLIAGAVLVPAFYAVLHLSGAGSMDDKLPWYQLGNIGNFINSFYPLNKVTTGNLFNHNNYCGTLIVLLVILVFFMKKIEWNRKQDLFFSLLGLCRARKGGACR